MNKDIVEGNWSEIKGKIKSKWAKLTDNDVEAFKGNLDSISGKIQKTYGYAKERADQESKEFRDSLTENKDAAH